MSDFNNAIHDIHLDLRSLGNLEMRLANIRGAEVVGFLLLMGILAAFGLIAEGFRRLREK